MRIGILPLGRATFDVAFAEEKLAAMLGALKNFSSEILGPRSLLTDGPAAQTAIAALALEGIDRLLILQVTFTDAATTVEAAAALDVPLSIWAVPEPRLGGRLRLNAFCGLNLASHALGLEHRDFGWLYADPAEVGPADLATLLNGEGGARRPAGAEPPVAGDRARDIAAALGGKRIARLGAPPAGFATCAYDPGALKALAGVEVDALDLGDLFTAARAAAPAQVAEARATAEAAVTGLAEVDQAELDRSLRLRAGLGALKQSGRYDAFAIRCWPETFTEYGGAVCGPVSMMGEARVPCACEADVYGALSQMILQEAAEAPVFLTDLVDVDIADDTGVVWHCGQAPISMRAEADAATATIHTNRKMPLLYQFALKPGRVTFLRISQAHGTPQMVLAGGEMLDRPMAFTGTSGVVRFDSPAADTLGAVIGSGLEHHMALAYGEHRLLLREVAGALGLPLLELTA